MHPHTLCWWRCSRRQQVALGGTLYMRPAAVQAHLLFNIG
jgi:hypothetical protein